MDRSKKRKVAFIHPDLGIGGAERLVLDIAVALTEQGHEVVFITNHFDKTHAFEELRDGKFPVRVVGDWIPRSLCGICQALCAYIRMIYLSLVYVLFLRQEDKPDVYIIDQIPMAVPFIKLVGGKVIYYCHHPDLLASPAGGHLKKLYRLPIDWVELKGTACADVLLVNSKYTASIFRTTFPEITEEIHVLYPTISTSYQNTIASNKTVRPIGELVPEIQSRTPVTFLSINRFHPAKKLELALDGFEALKSKLAPDDWARAHLVMAGGYDPQSTTNAAYFAQLVEISQLKNLGMKVTFLKSPSDELKADLLLGCDCLVYTPINEHFGIVPLEAMTAGKPVIACNSGGPCETVQHAVTGFLCEPTAEGLANAMVKIFDKDDANKMGLLGKWRLERFFSHATFSRCVNEVVDGLVTGAPLRLDSTVLEGKENEYESSSKKTDGAVVEEAPKCDISGKVEELLADDREGGRKQKRYLSETDSISSRASSCYLTPVSSSTENLDVSAGSDAGSQNVEIANEAFAE